MKLIVEMLQGSEIGAVRMIDGSVPFVIGTGPDALWKISPARSAARLELRHKGGHFAVIADGDVSVEGQPISDGVERTIHHGATVEIAGATLRVRVEQDQTGLGGVDMFASPTATTISSILSDVTPGGENAGGILPGHGGEDWLSSVIGGGGTTKPEPSEMAWGNDTQTERPLVLQNPQLPDDWASAQNESANRFEQTGADQQGLGFLTNNQDDHKAALDPGHAPERMPDTILLRRAAGLFEGEIDSSDAAQVQNAGHALKTLLEQVAELQRNLDIMLSDLRIVSASKDLVDQTAFQPGTILGDETGMSVPALARRLKTMRLEYSAVFAALTEAVAKSRETLDPDSILAAVSANYGPAARLQTAKTGWKEYNSRWSETTNPLGADKLTNELQHRLDDLREEFDW